MLEDTFKDKGIGKRFERCLRHLRFGSWGINYPIAIESALKFKELTYIHAEGIPGGELKHGPLALMDTNVFVIVINPDDSTLMIH